MAIAVKSCGCYWASNHQQLDYLFCISVYLAFCEGSNWWPVASPHKGPVMRKSLPCNDIIMRCLIRVLWYLIRFGPGVQNMSINVLWTCSRCYGLLWRDHLGQPAVTDMSTWRVVDPGGTSLITDRNHGKSSSQIVYFSVLCDVILHMGKAQGTYSVIITWVFR